MATTKNVLGLQKPELVGINLTTAGHLADALDRVGDGLADQARTALLTAASVDVLSVPAARLAAVATWAGTEAATLHALVERLSRLDGGPGPVRWHGGTDPAFAHPFRSVARGRAIVAAFEAWDLTAARRLLDAAAGDPVVATVLVAGLGVTGLLELLRLGYREWDRTDDTGAEQRAVVDGLGEALALAQANGTTTIGIDRLAEAADRAELPRSALALLFVGGARFPTVSLRAAVTAIVAPLNAQVLAEPGLGVSPWLLSRAGPLDARVVVLDAVARDRRAAMQAVGSTDLDELLPAACGYSDGGVALARVLLAATTPLDRTGAVVTAPLTTASPVDLGMAGVNAHRVIDWIGRHRDTPLAVQAELGRLAAPWIGSFRSAGLDGVVRRHLALDEELARSYLSYGQLRDGVAEDLEDAAWRWADVELDRLAGPRFDGGGFDVVGSVLGIVTATRLDAEVVRAVEEDERTRRTNALWERVAHLTTSRLPAPARVVADAATGRLLDEVLPRADEELRLWREARDAEVLHEHLALDHLAASLLVAHGRLRPVPTRLLVDRADAGAGLRNPLTFDATDIRTWTEWRSRTAVGGPAPLQLAGDQFLAETRGR